MYLCSVLSHTATASLQQPAGVAEESHTPLQPEAVKVTEPLEGPLGMLVMYYVVWLC